MKVEFVNFDGSIKDINVITYLNSKDDRFQYIVFSLNEKHNNEQIIYISKMLYKDETYYIDEIEDDAEWQEVQFLLKEIANKKE